MADLQPESMNRPSAVEQSQTLIVAKTNNHLTGHKTTKLQRSTQNQVFWVLRALFGVVGAILYTALYIVIIFVYVRRRGDNNVIDSPYPVNAKIVSGLWFVFSVFILDLSRIGLSACEAAGLTLISFAPSTAVKLLWHADKSWCTVTGLLSVITTAVTLLWQRLKDDRIRPSRSFPGRLWWILLFIHAPLWIAAPLSGLTFSLGTISTLTANDFSVIGVNESTFDLRGWTTVMDVAVIRWSQNLQTTPKAPNIFYAPAGSQHVSQTFYNDRISTFQDGDSISFFAAPEADSLLNGTAWGLKGNISCRLVNPLKDLQLLTVRDLGDFSNTTSGPVGYKESFDIYGASSAILAASNSSSEQFRSKGEDGYSYPSSVKGTDGQPVHDSQLEIVMWQYYNTSDVEDPTMKKMRNRDVVVASPLPEPSANPDILAFGLSFQIQSSVGYAEISARQRTYSNFRWFGSSPVLRNETYGLDPDCPGCLSDEVHCDDLKQLQCQNQEQKNQQMMQTISARHIIMLENLILAALTCEKMGGSMVPQTCFNAWYMANVATGGKLYAHSRRIGGRDDGTWGGTI
ncbi:hypothetical protein FOZG_18144 [Fusarium oxysporum Fo47]|uniref:Uncharacterized protein n=1 Tax=Fusarium oxysporum Fo47 TaxID=660027 RepID=W9JEK8_FUSOX|nr:hypothetical protein FOZG_18144 [Fusarium oxysporum Fo47]